MCLQTPSPSAEEMTSDSREDDTAARAADGNAVLPSGSSGAVRFIKNLPNSLTWPISFEGFAEENDKESRIASDIKDQSSAQAQMGTVAPE